MSGAHRHRYRPKRVLYLRWALIVIAMLATACFPGEAPNPRLDGPAILNVSGGAFLDLPEGTSVGHSVVFSQDDADRIGVPVENEMFALSNGRPSVRLEMESFFVGDLDLPEPIPLGCFDPIDIRNDTTGEILLSIEDYCPGGNDAISALNFRGVSNPEVPLGWSYRSAGGVQLDIDAE